MARRAKVPPTNQTRFPVRADRTQVDLAMQECARRGVTLSEMLRRTIWQLAEETPTLPGMPKPGRYAGARQTAERIHAIHNTDPERTVGECRSQMCITLLRELELT